MSSKLSIVIIALSLASAACDKKADQAPAAPDLAAPPAADQLAVPPSDAKEALDSPARITTLRAGRVIDGALRVEIPLDEAHSAAVDAAPEDQFNTALPLTTPLLPAAEREPVQYTLITGQGPVVAKPARGAIAERGGLPHLSHLIDAPDGVSGDKPVIAVVATAPLPATASARAAEAVSERVDPALLKLVRDQLIAAKGDPTAAERFNPEEHLRVYRGKFGDGLSLLVTYSVPYPPETEGEQQASYTSGMFFADRSGAERREALGEPTTAKIGVEQLVDLEGDGIEEVVYSLSYYEAYYLHALQIKDGTPTSTLLTGDGA